ncbi:MAG: hypothetical protein IPG04_07720 [Polyangiaceae bacterium]|nr:hypothetical protein [Polyangiaceae bacterium]
MLDVFGSTLVVFDPKVGDPDGEAGVIAELAREEAALRAQRRSQAEGAPRTPSRVAARSSSGRGRTCAARSREDGVRYAIRLLAHHDASFYLDTRELRTFVRPSPRARGC